MSSAEVKPNIVFILADDLGYGDLGCYGATKIPTPNIDRIAGEGTRFMDVHSTSAVCSPSRYSILTGRYCWRTRLKKWVLGGFGKPLIESEDDTIAHFLNAYGYATAAIGKWHLGLKWPIVNVEKLQGDWPVGILPDDLDFTQAIRGGPVELGFDYFFGISGSLDMPPYCFIENDYTVGIPSVLKPVCYQQQRQGPTVPGWKDEMVDIEFVKHAIQFLDRHVQENPSKPFFLYLATASPHRPCDVQPDFVKGKSQAGDRGDMVLLFDWVVGEIGRAIDRLGLKEDTLIIITSDNGARLTCYNGKDYGHKSCGDLRGQKADIWEGGHREPFIVRWPGKVQTQGINNDLVCLGDFFATISALLGEEIPPDIAQDSISVLPTILGTTSKGIASNREVLIHHSGGGLYSIRKGRWKLIHGLGSGGFSRPRSPKKYFWRPAGQLYDLESDPKETRNLWKTHPKVVQELLALLQGSIEATKTRELHARK